MSERTVRREQSAEVHLLAAAEYVAKGDNFYAKAADEIIAARKADPQLSYETIGQRVGKSRDWCRELVIARTNDEPEREGEFKVEWRRGSHGTREEFDRTVAERPERIIEAIEKAPPEAKRRIAERIAESSPEVRVEVRKRDVEQAERRKPSPVQPRGDHLLYQWDGKIATADRVLREALALLAEVDQAGDDADRLDALRRLRELVAANEEAYRTGKSIDTWAYDLYERSGTDG